MKFGKEFKTHLEETLPGWRDKFLCYKYLKKLLKNFPSITDDFHQQPPDNEADPVNNGNRALEDLQNWFVRILNEELEKFNDFYVDKEEEFVIRFQELKERIEGLKEKRSRGEVSASESEFSEEMMDIRKDFVTIHGEMVLLKNYSSLNFAGLVKILKKYDKRTGGLLRLPYTQLALHQPSFTTEPLTRLVRECEENLEVLFPVEAEVIEPSSTAQDQSTLPKNTGDVNAETSAAVGEETVDIYRSTLAAMRAIRSLQKASSTYNPLSFSSLSASKDDGAVTAEDSDSSSSGVLAKTEVNDDEETQST